MPFCDTMKIQSLLFLALLGRLNADSTDNGAHPECSHRELRLISENGTVTTNSRAGIVQLCINVQWRTVCRKNGWNIHAANVACRQLGYLDNGATADYTTANRVSLGPGSSINVMCQGIESQLIDCEPSIITSNCPPVIGNHRYAYVTCLEAECSDLDIRLVDGNNNREGRVEVCIDGRWGTVCRRGREQEAVNLLCRELGFPSEGGQFATFGEGTGPIYNFDCTEMDGIIECTQIRPTNPMCDHSMDVGVRCRAFHDVCQTNDLEYGASTTCIITIEPPSCATQSHTSTFVTSAVTAPQFSSIHPTESQSNICVASTVTVTNSNSSKCLPSTCIAPTVTIKTTASSTKSFTANQASMDITNTVVFQVITGILLVLLIAVIVGWTLTCVVMKTKNSNRSSRGDNQNIPLGNTESSVQVQRQLDNPVYDGTDVQPHPPASYSSLGPAYELVEANEGAGHTYDVINRNQQRGRNVARGRQTNTHNTSTESTSADLSSHHDYHVLEQSKGDEDHHDYHVLEQSKGNEDHHDYHVLEQNNENKQENNYHVLEQSSQVPHNVEEHCYHVLESNSSAAVRESGREGVLQARQIQRGGDGIDPDPQDYEIPTPRMKGVGEDEEEYSRLKH